MTAAHIASQMMTPITSKVRKGGGTFSPQTASGAARTEAVRRPGPGAFFKGQVQGQSHAYITFKSELFKGLGALNTAMDGLDKVLTFAETARGVARRAKDATDDKERQKLSEEFEDLRKSMDQAVEDSDFQGVNLLALRPDTLTVAVDAGDNGNLQVFGKDATSKGMKIDPVKKGWPTPESAEAALVSMEQAIQSLKETRSDFQPGIDYLQTRIDVGAGAGDESPNAAAAYDPNEAQSLAKDLAQKITEGGFAMTSASGQFTPLSLFQ